MEPAAADTVLSLGALNRATLARQLLLDRAHLSPHEAIGHLATEPFEPLPSAVQATLTAEGERLMRFVQEAPAP